MKTMHVSEADLIAYQLGESEDAAAVRAHLEVCAGCAAVSSSIAETLRVFSAEAVPEPDLDRNWHRVRGNLSVLSGTPRRGLSGLLRGRLLWPAAGLAAAALALMIVGLSVFRTKHFTVPAGDMAAIRRQGPLTATPADPEIARQLDRAERLLTEVNHAQGPLDESTRAQAHDLLLKNAVYIQAAHDRGDLGTAAVLDTLGRVLTNIDHESQAEQSGWHLRLELNTDGLLLDIRILRQNHAGLS